MNILKQHHLSIAVNIDDEHHTNRSSTSSRADEASKVSSIVVSSDSVVGGGTCSSSGNNIKTVATTTITNNTVTNTASTNTTTAVVSNSNNSIAVVDVVPPEEEEEVSSTTVVVATSVLPTTESSPNGISANSTATNIKDNTSNNGNSSNNIMDNKLSNKNENESCNSGDESSDYEYEYEYDGCYDDDDNSIDDNVCNNNKILESNCGNNFAGFLADIAVPPHRSPAVVEDDRSLGGGNGEPDGSRSVSVSASTLSSSVTESSASLHARAASFLASRSATTNAVPSHHCSTALTATTNKSTSSSSILPKINSKSSIHNNSSPSLKRSGAGWTEPSREAISMSLRAETEKTGGKRRLAQDLYRIMAACRRLQKKSLKDDDEHQDHCESSPIVAKEDENTKNKINNKHTFKSKKTSSISHDIPRHPSGFAIEPMSEDSMDRWTVRLFDFDDDSALYDDLVVLNFDHVELEMRFPEQYPFEPPFVRVVRPRFQAQSGFVMNGALCMELLTNDGWNPVNDIESVIVSIRSLLVVGNGRLQGAIDMGVAERERLLDEHAFKLGKNRDEKKKGKRKRCEDEGLDSEYEDYEINEDGVVKQPVKGDLESSSSSSKRTAKRKNDNNNKAEKNRINRRPVVPSNVSAGHYTVAESKAAYSHLTEYHRKKGWDNTGWWAKNG